jgi:hypothetical protein
MIVANAIFETRRRSGRLDAPDQALGHQQAQRVVHRLQGDRTDLGPDNLGYGVGRDVRVCLLRSLDGQPLCGHVNPASTKQRRRFGHHTDDVP